MSSVIYEKKHTKKKPWKSFQL